MMTSDACDCVFRYCCCCVDTDCFGRVYAEAPKQQEKETGGFADAE